MSSSLTRNSTDRVSRPAIVPYSVEAKPNHLFFATNDYVYRSGSTVEGVVVLVVQQEELQVIKRNTIIICITTSERTKFLEN